MKMVRVLGTVVRVSAEVIGILAMGCFVAVMVIFTMAARSQMGAARSSIYYRPHWTEGGSSRW